MTDAAIALCDTPFAAVTVEQGVAVVMIDRPERRNALHPSAHRSLHTVFDTLPQDPSIRAVIVTGRGDKAFCAGYDLKDNLETGEMFIPESGFGGFAQRIGYPLPVIAAVNGVAFGGGFELALACDFIIAAESAQFGLPEPTVGWAAFSGLVHLPRAIGMKRAMDMILTGRAVSAVEGERLGFVSEVVADAELLAAAKRWAGQIAACAPIAIRASKQIVYGAADQPDLAAALDVKNYDMMQVVLDSEDAIEGKRAFAERRKPNWTGR